MSPAVIAHLGQAAAVAAPAWALVAAVALAAQLAPVAIVRRAHRRSSPGGAR